MEFTLDEWREEIFLLYRSLYHTNFTDKKIRLDTLCETGLGKCWNNARLRKRVIKRPRSKIKGRKCTLALDFFKG